MHWHAQATLKDGSNQQRLVVAVKPVQPAKGLPGVLAKLISEEKDENWAGAGGNDAMLVSSDEQHNNCGNYCALYAPAHVPKSHVPRYSMVSSLMYSASGADVCMLGLYSMCKLPGQYTTVTR